MSYDEAIMRFANVGLIPGKHFCLGAFSNGSTVGPTSGIVYLNYSRRRKVAESIFDVIGHQVPFAGVPIHEFCSFVFEEFMCSQGAKQFRRFKEHGFSILPLSDDLSTKHELSFQASKELNGILRYHIF